ncbi:mechanosensitive ion channel domain-containing protein [Flavobacterium sp.]|uniref:mechanosensitive ion channel family protein n=1 Tax=Flavobacterium sp. TaxID=239 RepID=UPI0008D54DCC|nr:mechanosensitive ion channel domain-containing protein [Flavobacterium sp.]OGS63184.1 MAG: mechanosensitive ion channel protein [Flavobacteria bacterium GWF1_32_7]HBD26725.1 mechanosensitive ion channel protein [Flavobacterium sp.]
MNPTEIQNYIETIKKLILEYSPKFVVAIIILVVGLWATSFITKTAKKVMIKRNVELTLSNFIGNLIFWTLRVLLFVTVISKLGIETSAFVTILGAAGLAIGLSLQGSLSNFAGGILIILFKPFRLGDTIEAHGEIGKVDEILIFSTRLITATNQVIYIPNGILSNGKIKNYSQLGIRRADLVLKTNYDSNFPLIKTSILNFSSSHDLVLQDPKPEILVTDLSETTIVFTVKVWTNNNDYPKVTSDILEFSKNEISL